MNQTVLMSGADYFSDQFAINAHMGHKPTIDIAKAMAEHAEIRQSLEAASVKIIQVSPPKDCQDGVYTANWALCRGKKALMSVLPRKREAEMPYAADVLKNLGKQIVYLPSGLRFSGQGDALPCGNYLFVGSNYRTDLAAHPHIQQILGYQVVSLQTIPKRHFWGLGKPVVNKVTGWPDSYYYDIDLALAVLTPDLIAYCPEAFVPASRQIIEALPLQKIKVSRAEATKGFACNLISTGQTVVMSAHAPKLKRAIEAHGLKTITPNVSELGKGGGYIRCSSLTLDNA